MGSYNWPFLLPSSITYFVNFEFATNMIMTKILCAFLLGKWLLISACLTSGSVSASSGVHQLNIYGRPLDLCSNNPMTGWYRDGYARTDDNDRGRHVVCATMTAQFLDFTKNQGNDLSTPRLPSFPGFRAGAAPLVKLEATHQKSLDYITLDILESFDDG